MSSKCQIAKDLLKKNKEELKKLEKAVDRDIKNFEKTTNKEKSNITDKDFEKMGNLIKERNEYTLLQQTLRTNDIINETAKKLKSNPENIDSIVEETLLHHINKVNSADRVGEAYKKLSEMKISKRKNFKTLKENIKKDTKLKVDVEQTGYYKSDLKESTILKSEKIQKKLKNEEQVASKDTIVVDYEDASHLKDFQPLGFSRDFFSRLFNQTGSSSAAKNFTMGLLSYKWGFLKGKNGKIIPQTEALDKKFDRILNKFNTEWDVTIKRMFENEFKDMNIINKISTENEQMKLILEFKEFMYLRMDTPNIKPEGKYAKFKEIVEQHDKHMAELYKKENIKGELNKVDGYTPTAIDRNKIKEFVIQNPKNGVSFLKKMIKESILKKIKLDNPNIILNEGQLINVDNITHDYITRLLHNDISVNKIKETNIEDIFYESLKNIDDKEMLELLLKEGVEKTKSSFRKSKLPMLYGHSDEFNGKTYRILDFMMDNHLDVSKGSIVERKKLLENKPISIRTNSGKFIEVDIFDDISVGKFIDYLVQHEGVDGVAFGAELKNIINDVKRSQFIENELKFGGEGAAKFIRTFRNLNSATMLASVILPSLVETGNVITAIGIGNFMKASKEYRTLIKKIKKGDVLTIEEKHAAEDLLYTSSSETFQIKKTNFNYETDSKINLQPKTIGDKVENWSSKYQDLIINKINQLSNLTSYTRGVAVMGYISKLGSMKKLNKLRAAELGWSESESQLFIDKLKGLSGSSSSKYEQMREILDKEQFNKFTYGLLNKGEALVLNPHIGEGYEILTKNAYGKLFLAFQTYITTALNKMLFKGMYIHDAEFFLTLTASSFTSSMVEMLKEISKGENPLKPYGDNDLLAISTNAIKNNSYAANTTFFLDNILSISGVNTNFSKRYDFDTSVKSAGDILNKTVPSSKVNQVYKLLNELGKDNVDGAKVADKLRKIFIGNILLTAGAAKTILESK